MTSNKRNTPLGFSTRAIHHGYDPAEHKGAVSPPVYFTSTYSFESVEENEPRRISLRARAQPDDRSPRSASG